MLKKMLVVFALLVTVSPVIAAHLTFSWTKNQENTVGYRIYRDPSTTNQFVFPDFLQEDVCNIADKPGKCEATVPDILDGKNHRYVATAYNSAGESDFSAHADTLVVVEKTEVPAIPQQPNVPAGYMHLLIPIEVVK